MLKTFIETFRIKLPEEYQAEYRRLMDYTNAEKVVLISGLGVLFFLLLSILDIQRISSGEFFEAPIYPLLMATHLVLGFLIIPGYFVYKNIEKIKIGDYPPFRRMLILTIFLMGLSLAPMSVLGTVDKRGLVTFAAYMIIVNLIFNLDRNTRLWANLISAAFVIMGVCYVHADDTVTMVALIIEVLGVGLPVYMISAYQYNMGVRQFLNEKTLEKQNAIIQEKLKNEYDRRIAEIEMKALRAQMNPHFLFNVLNSIKLFMVENKPEKASLYLTKFSRLIRLILNNSKNKMVCLADELEALKLYIEMENFRFNDKFDFVFEIDPDLHTETLEIPPLILQPYVENAIWHGLMHKEDGRGHLKVIVRRENESLRFVIEDNGIGREKSQSLNTRFATSHESLGMKITKDRIQRTNEVYGMTAKVDVVDLKTDDGQPAGTRVILDLPVN
ncbi:MAG: hypothetical protein D6714_07120 [Bacteroidetes bacterium]|nr:MAG: hypothetical protein D6714_07120 [Bacteroidota bacterium]